MAVGTTWPLGAACPQSHQRRKITVIRTRTLLLSTALFLAGALPGCDKASSEAPLVTNPTGPAGYSWQAASVPNVGAYELPSGGKWEKVGLGASNDELDMTISVQIQGGVEPSDRAAMMKGLIDANKRDAPKYELIQQIDGQVNGTTAGRVDGKFDNGTPYATRDYVLFKNHMALAMMVRGPVGKQAEVQALADRVAGSLK